MTIEQLQIILDDLRNLTSENEIVEFKEAKNNYDFSKLGKYFSALSNEANLCGKPYGWLVFGVEDKIKENFNRPTKTHGQDWSDSLYALAKIESRFRTDSEIYYGNTLTDIKFIEKRFDVIVAESEIKLKFESGEICT